ncbi:hypothetical protein R1sor_018263 [Riccia sorocarpa]|uniref:X8 domain-containing protein n=1 Tax=Riccia sorocarpa TaxID=122646 RepID=A0ABD3ID90_9MARC
MKICGVSVVLVGAFLISWISFGPVVSHAEPLGMNWGDISRQPLPPEIVVRMLKDNNITRVKLFDTDYNTLKALVGSGIEVMVAAPNELLNRLASSEKAAREWVKQNVTRYTFAGGVNIKYVAIGNEPFLVAYNGTYQNVTYPALLNVQKALADAGYANKIFATVPFNADVLCGPQVPACNVPSGGVFRPDIADLMVDITASLNRTGAPFCLNIYPFLSLALSQDFPIDYAFFGNFSLLDPGSNAVYTNVFDASYDTLVQALDRAGFTSMHIIIGEIGWPTDGDGFATVQLAQKFNNQVMTHLAQKKGTPLRPNQEFDVYLFGLLDENLKSIDPGSFERHWGIFYYDGQPKYPLDFSGQGNLDVFPKAAVGVEYLDQRYCVVNVNAIIDPSILAKNVDYACQRTDCSALQPGGSCYTLDDNTKASYAFNNYYQFNYEDKFACYFDGLAILTSTDPSPSDMQCQFRIGLNYHPTTTSGVRKSGNTLTACVLLILAGLFLLF